MGDLTSSALLGGWLFGHEMSKSQSRGVEQAKEDLKLVCLSICWVSPRREKVGSDRRTWNLNSKASAVKIS